MALTVDIKVAPQSGRLQCIIDKSGKLKCYVKAAPENGKANNELVAFIAKSLKITQDKVRIIAGATSRSKRLLIQTDLNINQFLQALGIEEQLTVFHK
jgi:uncharacterized protein